MQKIQQKTEKRDITWRHCLTKENPADIGTRGAGDVSKLWLKGPSWLRNKENWPKNIVTTNNKEMDEERKMLKEIHMTVNVAEDHLAKMLKKLSRLFRLYRITAWIRRFINNCRRQQIAGELSSGEINTAENFWLKRTQEEVKGTKQWE